LFHNYFAIILTGCNRDLIHLFVCSVWAHNFKNKRSREINKIGVNIPQGRSAWCAFSLEDNAQIVDRVNVAQFLVDSSMLCWQWADILPVKTAMDRIAKKQW